MQVERDDSATPSLFVYFACLHLSHTMPIYVLSGGYQVPRLPSNPFSR
jgi:hypothetical protein